MTMRASILELTGYLQEILKMSCKGEEEIEVRRALHPGIEPGALRPQANAI